MRIIKMEPSRHKRGRWRIGLDDGSFVCLGEGEVAALSLYAGKELDEEGAASLAAAAEQGRMNERALGLLSLRPMSRRELLDKLTASKPSGKREKLQGPAPDPEELERERENRRRMAEAAADRLEELGLINDREYAHTVARHYAEKGCGPRKVRDELYRRGVPREYWDEALAEAAAPGESDVLEALLEKKLRGAEPTRENLKRASDYLARRGYGWSEITEAIERYRDGWQAEEEDA